VSKFVGDFTVTLTRICRLPTRTNPCQPVAPAFASVTIPLSKSALPSLNACHVAAALNVDSVHPLI
jgi:hypothetical protein